MGVSEQERSRSVVIVAPNDDGRDVRHALQRVGYPGAAALRPAAVAQVEPDLLVCLVPASGDSTDALASVLGRFPQTPGLGLFPRSAPRWDPGLIELCHEFTAWPCGDEELGFRLRRIETASGRLSLEAALDPGDALVDLNIVGRSPSLRRAVGQIRKLSRCDAPVLIGGESGTGKELAARGIHYNSARRDRPFVAVNCGALPEQLAENELFGHERGAYTNAGSRQAGLIAEAAGGTLFLDEVQALNPHTQAALLRFLDDGSYRPLGASGSHTADVRIIAASNADIAELAGDGRFRADLFYRLDVLSLRLPPLRQRLDDLVLLADHFMGLFRARYDAPEKYLAAGAIPDLQRYAWPGNIRELENRLHRAFVLSDQPRITCGEILGDRPGAITGDPGGADAFRRSFHEEKAEAVERFERAYLRWVLAQARGNVSDAARRAGKERRALGKLLKKHGIDCAEFRGRRAAETAPRSTSP